MLLKPPYFPATKTRRVFSTLSSLLNLCTHPKTLRQLHARYIIHGHHQDPSLSSLLIHRYAALGLPSLSSRVFNSIAKPTPIHYNAVLRSLAEFESTVSVYDDMVMKGMYPDEGTYPYVLGSCSRFSDARIGARVHGHVVKLGLDLCEMVRHALVDMYRSYGEFGNEGKVFDEIPMWRFDSVSLVNWLRSSVDLNSLRVGKAVHCVAVVTNLCGDLSVNTALLSMYAKLGELECAELVFDGMPGKDCVVWNIMISAYSRNGRPKESLELLRFMGRLGVRADMFTAIPAISSIARLRAMELGRQTHAHVIRNGLDYQVSVHNSLIDMYCECNRLSSARRIFDMVRDKTVVSWSAMIKGYVTHDQSLDALALFSEMKCDGVGVDFITVINILPACVNLGALENVKYFHGYSMKLSLNSLSSVNTAFLVSYAKCGCIEMARKLFDEENINEKDVITWNSMVGAYAKHGDWYRSFELYNQMKELSIKPDQVTFLGLLTACVNAGLVQEGKKCFKEMIDIYGYKPSQEHYACMADLLGRAGQVNEASELIKSMPFKPDARVWGPLLSACKLHSDTGVADFAAEKLITIEPNNAGNLILLANIKAAAGKWDEVAPPKYWVEKMVALFGYSDAYQKQIMEDNTGQMKNTRMSMTDSRRYVVQRSSSRDRSYSSYTGSGGRYDNEYYAPKGTGHQRPSGEENTYLKDYNHRKNRKYYIESDGEFLDTDGDMDRDIYHGHKRKSSRQENRDQTNKTSETESDEHLLERGRNRLNRLTEHCSTRKSSSQQGKAGVRHDYGDCEKKVHEVGDRSTRDKDRESYHDSRRSSGHKRKVGYDHKDQKCKAQDSDGEWSDSIRRGEEHHAIRKSLVHIGNSSKGSKERESSGWSSTAELSEELLDKDAEKDTGHANKQSKHWDKVADGNRAAAQDVKHARGHLSLNTKEADSPVKISKSYDNIDKQDRWEPEHNSEVKAGNSESHQSSDFVSKLYCDDKVGKVEHRYEAGEVTSSKHQTSRRLSAKSNGERDNGKRSRGSSKSGYRRRSNSSDDVTDSSEDNKETSILNKHHATHRSGDQKRRHKKTRV